MRTAWSMVDIRELHHRAGTGDAFKGFAARVRTTHGAKRTLMKLLDECGW
jgi:hypothetical protein